MDKGLKLLMDHLTEEYMEAVKVFEYNEDISGTNEYTLPDPREFFGKTWKIRTMDDLEQEAYDYIKGNLHEVSVDDMERATGLDAGIFIALSEFYREDTLKEYYRDLIDETIGLADLVDCLVNVNGLGYYVSYRDGKMIYLGNDDNGEELWAVRV